MPRLQPKQIQSGNNDYVLTTSGGTVVWGPSKNAFTHTSSGIITPTNVYGNTISLGSNYSTIGGGSGNTITNTKYSSIGGGKGNIINTNGPQNANNLISGGYLNRIVGYSYGGNNSIIGGGGYNGYGYGNQISGGTSNTIVGGYTSNEINNGAGGFIGGGRYNIINGGIASVIIGGSSNEINGNSSRSLIAAGSQNTIAGQSSFITGSQNDITGGVLTDDAFVVGRNNTVNSSKRSSIVSGRFNTINSSNYSTVGGRSNVMNHNDSHIFGFNITSVSANTTHVEKLNVKTLNGTTPTTLLATDVNGMVVDGSSLASTVQELNDLTDVTTGLPPLSGITNVDDGKLLHYDVATNQWVTDDSVNHGTVVINAKKGSAGTIVRGLPVYLTGFDNDLHQVELANATSSATMPVIGFTAEVLDNTNIKHVITFGKLQNVDLTSANTTLNPNAETWNINDALYISTTTGGLTKVRPTGATTLIQRIAKVLKEGTSGQLFIFNTARSAGLPNLTENSIWIGNSDNQPIEADINSFGFVTGSGTVNYVPKWESTTGLTSTSLLYDDGTTVSVNTTTPTTGFTFFVSGDTKVIGHFEADTKSFDIVHPSDSSKRLRHGSLEGPEFGVYFRGKSTTNVIELPTYWKDLVDEETITVQLTPFGKQQNLYVGNSTNIEVEVLGEESPQYFFTVYGERKDIDKLTIEY